MVDVLLLNAVNILLCFWSL